MKQVLPPLTNHERRVKEMMAGFGQLPTKTFGPKIPDEKTRILRVRLLLEEVLELAEASGVHVALRNGNQPTKGVDEHTQVTMGGLTCYADLGAKPNLVEMVDALADISVVNTGAFIACGVRMASILEVVDANNLMKVANGHLDEHGKFIKPENHPKVNLRFALELQGWQPKIQAAEGFDLAEFVGKLMTPDVAPTQAVTRPDVVEIPDVVVPNARPDEDEAPEAASAIPTYDKVQPSEIRYRGPHKELVVELIRDGRARIAASWMEDDLAPRGILPGEIDPNSLRVLELRIDSQAVVYKLHRQTQGD